MKRSWTAVGAIVAVLFVFVACDRAESQIVGKWKVVGDPNSAAVWEFSANKSVDMDGRKGKYSFGDQGRIKVQTQVATFVYQLDVSDDRMALSDPNGGRIYFERVK